MCPRLARSPPVLGAPPASPCPQPDRRASPLHAHQPSSQPLLTQLAQLYRLAEDIHVQLRWLAEELEQVTRRNVVVIEQLRLAVELASR